MALDPPQPLLRVLSPAQVIVHAVDATSEVVSMFDPQRHSDAYSRDAQARPLSEQSWVHMSGVMELLLTWRVVKTLGFVCLTQGVVQAA